MSRKLVIQVAKNSEGFMVGFNIVQNVLMTMRPDERPSLGFYVIGKGESKTAALQMAAETAKTDKVCIAHNIAACLPEVPAEDSAVGVATPRANAPVADAFAFRSGETAGAPGTSAKPAANVSAPAASNVSVAAPGSIKHKAGVAQPVGFSAKLPEGSIIKRP